MLEKYRKFLCGGGSKYPLELLADAGVSFDTCVEDCMNEFARALDEFEETMRE